MARHLHFRPDSGNFAVCADEKGGPLDAHIALAIHRFFDPDAELLADITFIIGAEFDGQPVLGPEFRLFGGGILGNPDDGAIRGLELVLQR